MKHELTVTLRPLLYSKTPQQQFDIVKPMMLYVLKPYINTTIAELTGEHNVHFHSIIEIEGIIMKDQLLDRFRQYNKYLGRKSCSAVQYEESYEKYIQKSYFDTTKILIDPILKDDYKIFHKVITLLNVAPLPTVSNVEFTPSVDNVPSTLNVYGNLNIKLIKYLKDCDF